MIDVDHVGDALRACVAPRRHRGDVADPAVERDCDVAAFGQQVRRFLTEIPAELGVGELLELLEEAIAA